MGTSLSLYLDVAMGLIAALLALLATSLQLFSLLQTAEQRERMTARFRRYWDAVSATRWPRMPEMVISSLVKSFTATNARLWSAFNEPRPQGGSRLILGAVFLGFPLFLAGFFLMMSKLIAAPKFYLYDLLFLSALLVIFLARSERVIYCSGILAAIIMCLIGALGSLKILCSLPIGWGFVLALLGGPALGGVLMISLGSIPWLLRVVRAPVWHPSESVDYPTWSLLAAFGTSSSFVITYAAILTGSLFASSVSLPNNIQMLLANALFDGLTFAATYILLEQAIQHKNLFSVPLAILATTVAALSFAVLSLWCGLAFTREQISVTGILQVLLARTPDGNSIELGPYFWILYSSLLPVLLYLVMILVAWLAKVQSVVLAWFFSKGVEGRDPINLTSALMGVIAAFVGFLAVLIVTLRSLGVRS